MSDDNEWGVVAPDVWAKRGKSKLLIELDAEPGIVLLKVLETRYRVDPKQKAEAMKRALAADPKATRFQVAATPRDITTIFRLTVEEAKKLEDAISIAREYAGPESEGEE